MAFANTIGSPTTTGFATATTAHLVAMPSTVLADELLVVVIALNGAITVAVPSGWTEKSDDNDGDGISLAVYAKKAIGDEDGTTVDFVSSVAKKGAAQCHRITGWSGILSEVEVGVAATGVDATSDPPSLTLATGSADNLWLAFSAMNGVQTVSSGPTNYSTPVTNTAGSGETATLSTVERDVAAATEDPGVFTWNASDEHIAQTLGVPPVSAAAPVYPPFPRRANRRVRM